MNPGSGRPITVAPSPLMGERKTEPPPRNGFIVASSPARGCKSRRDVVEDNN